MYQKDISYLRFALSLSLKKIINKKYALKNHENIYLAAKPQNFNIIIGKINAKINLIY
jgi:hypothetical protein